MLKATLLCTLAILLADSSLNAQPGISWIRHYDVQNSDQFLDIYQTTNGDFALCGRNFVRGDSLQSAWIARVSDDGNLLWSHTFGGNGQRDEARSIIETDAGTLVTCGEYQDRAFAAMYEADGDRRWLHFYGNGSGEFNAVIELKNGRLLLAGSSADSEDGYLCCISNDGEVIWNGYYEEGETHHILTGIRETDDGIVASGKIYRFPRRPLHKAWAIKVDFEGDQIWSTVLDLGEDDAQLTSIISRQGGFILGGKRWDTQGEYNPDIAIYFIDSEGNVEDELNIDLGMGYWDWVQSMVRLPQGKFAIVGTVTNYFQWAKPYAMVFNADGSEDWRRIFDDFNQENGYHPNSHRLEGVVFTPQGELVACGCTYLDEGRDLNLDGLVMKLEPLNLIPQLVYWEPKDTAFSVLPDDRVRFLVRAQFRDPDSLYYTWLRNGEFYTRDTTVTIEFDTLGQELITCIAAAEEFAVSIRWHVTVTDMYIAAASPTPRDLTIGRGDSLLFSIDTVRFLGDVEPAYHWELTNVSNGNSEELGEDSTVSILFNRTGRYQVEASASRWDTFDEILWNVSVIGDIRAYFPENLTFDAAPDSLVHFAITLTDPEDHGFYIRWRVNGERVVQNEIEFDWRFARGGEAVNIVQAIVSQDDEADTVTWEVTVRDLAVPEDGSSVTSPQATALLSVSPNPFNSSTTITFSQSPHAIAGGVGGVSLRIYDLSGRLVTDLLNRRGVLQYAPTAGTHKVIWDAGGLSAGLYLVKLSAGNQTSIAKALLIR